MESSCDAGIPISRQKYLRELPYQRMSELHVLVQPVCERNDSHAGLLGMSEA